VVGTAEGRVVVGAEVVVGATALGTTRRTGADDGDPQAAARAAVTTLRARAVLLAPHRVDVTSPPSRSDRLTAGSG
jgi:hypothetical protein